MRRLLAAMASVIVLAGCGTEGPVGAASDPSETPSTSPSPLPTPTGTFVGPGRTTDPAGWDRYVLQEAALSFAFPPLEGRAELDRVVAEDGPGAGFDVFLKIRRGYDIAGVASKWATAGRECEITDAYRWSGDEDAVEVRLPVIAKNCHYTIDPIEIYERPDGLRAVLFDLWQYLRIHRHPEETVPDSRDLIAILELPEEHHAMFRVITFVLDIDGEGRPFDRARLPDATIEDARTVIDSVTFQ